MRDDDYYQELFCALARDASENEVSAFDLVEIISVPEEYYYDYEDLVEGRNFYSQFVNSFGIVSYTTVADGSMRWYSDGNKMFYIKAIGKRESGFILYDMALPSECVRKINRNSKMYAAIGILSSLRNWIDSKDFSDIDEERNTYKYISRLLIEE